MSVGRLSRQRCVRSCLLAFPLILFMFLFSGIPIFEVLRASISSTQKFITVEHFRAVFHHHNFIRALSNTVLIACLSLVVQLLCGIGCALFVHHLRWGRGLILALFLLPLGVPTIVHSSIMRYVFDQYGYMNQALLVLGVITERLDWLSGGWLSVLVIIGADLWKVLPFMVLIILAGRKTIDASLYEAARIDGASGWQQFSLITLPLLMPFIMMAVVVRGIDVFRLFELPLALFGVSFPLLSTYAYFEYAEYNNPHVSAAASVILLTCIVLFLVITNRIKRKITDEKAAYTA